MGKSGGYWSVVEPIWETVSIYGGPKVFESQFAAAPERARNLLAAHWCQSEVCNGGFHQFFTNSTGVLAPEAALAFLTLGMPHVARIVQEAVAWFGTSYPRSREVRQQALRGQRPFEALDEAFFRYIDSEAGGFSEAADAYANAG